MSELESIKYCSVCGSLLIRKKYMHHYNPYDGSEVYHTIVRCPKNNWIYTHYRQHYDSDGNYYPSYGD